MSYEVLYITILHFTHKNLYMAPSKNKFLAPPLLRWGIMLFDKWPCRRHGIECFNWDMVGKYGLVFGRCTFLKALASKNAILYFFTISKSNFTTYTIPFYNFTHIKKLYSFTFSLKYYFLIFLYYIFSITTFFQIPTVTFS